MSVTVAAVDASDRRGGWIPDPDRRLEALEEPIRALLARSDDVLTAADRLTIVPDARYPFHPSSGTVTDPAVVAAIVADLERRTGADVAVAGASDEHIAFDRTAEYLGYTALLEGFDADLVDLDGEPRRHPVVTVGDERRSVSVPERLYESTVVVVPTLRPTETGLASGGVRTLGRFATSVADPDRTAVAALHAAEPVLSVLDATVAFSGEPIAADALIGGPVSAVDAIASSLLERSIEEDPVLGAAIDDPPEAIERVSAGVDSERDAEAAADPDANLAALRRRLPDGDLPASTDTHPAVTAAYRLYAAVAGDAVPPQLEGDG